MAIALDTGQQGAAYQSAKTLTWSHTCTGSGRVLYVCVHGTLDEIPTITYNGVSPDVGYTAYVYESHAGSATMVSFTAPATGANNIVVTFSTAQNCSGGSISLTGCSGSDSIVGFNSSNSSSTAIISSGSNVPNGWNIGFVSTNTNSAPFITQGTQVYTEGATQSSALGYETAYNLSIHWNISTTAYVAVGLTALEGTQASASPSLSPSVSPSLSPSQSLSPSVSPSVSPSSSLSPSLSPSKSPSISPSASPSGNPSFSPSISPSLSPSLSPSKSPSLSPSVSPSASPSVSPSPSPQQLDFDDKSVEGILNQDSKGSNTFTFDDKSLV